MGAITKWLDQSAQLVMSLIPGRSMATPAPDDPFWYESVMGLPGLSGIVGGDNAWMFVSSSCAAMRVLCGVGAMMPLERKRAEVKDGRNTANVMSKDPVNRLMNYRPNPLMTSRVFRSQMIGWQIGHGTAFAEIQRDLSADLGKPYRLWPIHPCRTKPFINETDNELWWEVRNKGADPTRIPDTNMLRVPYTLIDDDGIHGLGVGKMAARAIGLGQTLEKTETVASSTSLPRIVVESTRPMGLPEQDAFRRQWSQWIEGGENIPVMLINGDKAKELNWSAVDSDMRARREFNKQDLANWFGVPLALLDGTEDLSLLFQKISLHYLELWEPECDAKLLSESDRDDGQCWENDYKSLLKQDPVARSTYYNNRFSVGSLQPNDIKVMEGENPSTTEGMNIEYIQGAMRRISDPYKTGAENPVGNPKDGKAPPLAPVKTKPSKGKNAVQAARSAVKMMLSATLSRMTVKEMKRAKCDASHPDTFIPKLEEFYAEHRQYLVEALTPVCEAAKAVGLAITAERATCQWCDESMERLLTASEAKRGQLSAAVETCVSDWNSARVEEFVETVQPRKKRAVPC